LIPPVIARQCALLPDQPFESKLLLIYFEKT
jgi:hypothetical protein